MRATLLVLLLLVSSPGWATISISGSGEIRLGISGAITLSGVTEAPPAPSSGWLNATMTSNTSPEPNECYDDYMNANVYLCFDHNAGTSRLVIAPESYMVFDFGTGNSEICNKVYLTQGGVSMGIKNWVFSGSNNGSTWTSLGSGIAADSDTRQALSITNTTAYRYYKLSWSSVYDEMAMETFIHEVELWNE